MRTYCKFVLLLIALGLVAHLNAMEVVAEPLKNQTPILFHNKIEDTQKQSMLNPFCLFEAMEMDDNNGIKYDVCVMKNKKYKAKQSLVDNLDQTKNIMQYFERDGSSYYFSYAGKLDRDTVVFEYTWNGGGSGRFSSLQFFKLEEDKMLYHLGGIDGGDRCNDGHIEYLYSENDQIYFAKAATPFRLLNFNDNTVMRYHSLAYARAKEENKNLTYNDYLKQNNIGPFFNNLKPYDDIDNSAISCYGYTVHRNYVGENHTVGILLNKPFKKINEAFKEDCFDKWLTNLTLKKFKNYAENQDYFYLGSSEWEIALYSFKDACPADKNL